MGVITLLTDFGHRDSYVGVMKGVIAGISPQSQVIDLTHGIRPQAILAARFNLLISYKYFPEGTVHVVVVDPGVGTQRVAIATQVMTPAGLQTVVAPDNGILTGFPVVAAVALTNSDYWYTSLPSYTFHGRDIFAPVAAHLANGVAMDELGAPLAVSDLLSLAIGDAIATDRGYCGSIQYSDHFGNLVTNIPGETLVQQPWHVRAGKERVPYHTTYGDAQPGTLLALIGSHGYVEIAMSNGSAAERLAMQVGNSVELIYGPHG